MPPAANEISGLGARTLVPYRASLDWSKVALTAEEGFILSRVDGSTSLGDICMLLPFPEIQTADFLRKMWLAGVIDIPGLERPSSITRSVAPVAELLDVDLPSAVPAGIGLTLDQLQRIELFSQTLERRNAFQTLEIDHHADDKTLKKAYFKLSKEFHPDRFYGKEIGDFRTKVNAIFQAIKTAFELLSDGERRAAYEESMNLQK